MPFARLNNRAIVTVTGPDAEHFLQNILTTDLDKLDTGEAKPGALLTPQGKILFDFLISRSGADGLRLECNATSVDDFVRRLMLYRLRAKAGIAKQDQALVVATWGDDSRASQTDSILADRRFATGNVMRCYGGEWQGDGDHAGWEAFRIAAGIAESGSDYQLGDAFPHDVLLDQTGGVGFSKGCYVGQEVVSRMQHRGTARRRVLLVTAQAPLPAPGTKLAVEGRAVGTLGSSAGTSGLAVVRIDRVKDALDNGQTILAGDIPVNLSIPGWARFTFPESDGAKPAGAEPA
ncbi:YgfZ/GcvT domain-containing protein [Manganibacter manganicus]|uniref:Aminomethyltransferase n=1 Tax=Manganibacter manganicus TaxID=1873176 RepID=A0A1V8RJZ7_9HYPH|nr:folate-binding protein YgfZ [Pseudaminobacter manganicus]OQM73532.1 aminomethyltransferase [Pseudaminobacter manganicus]